MKGIGVTSYAAALCVTLAVVGQASADVVVRYDFTGNTGSEASETWSEIAPHAIASPLTRGPGLQPAGAADSFGAKHWSGPQATDFLSFSVAPALGYELDLTSFSLGVLGDATPNEPLSLSLFSSLDGYVSPVFSVPLTAAASMHFVSLGPEFLNLTGPVDFRFVAMGATANGKLAALTNQNGTPGLVLNGFVSPAAVPEPGSMALLALSGLTAIGLRRLRQHRASTESAA